MSGIFNIFKSGTDAIIDDGTGEFNRIDIQAVKAELKLAKRARDDGKNDIPSPRSESKDPVAADIDLLLSEFITRARSKVHNRLKAMRELSQTQLKSDLTVKEIFQNARAELTNLARERYNELFLEKRDWILGEQEYSNFRDKHKRVGPARYPDTNKGNWGVIFLCFIFEIIVGAFVLGSSHREGPIGVIGEIFLYSFSNLALASFLSFLWRWLYHVNAFIKLSAFVLMLLIIAGLISLNFFAAHYRDALSSLASVNSASNETLIIQFNQLGRTAWNSLLSAPLIMDGYKSYLLLVTGLIVAILATHKFFQMDDPYPGYGKLQRQQKELGERFNDRQAESLEDMNNLVTDHKQQITNQINLIQAGKTAHTDRKGDAEQLIQKYRDWLPSVQKAGDALYAFYRQENMKARQSQKEPVCFQHPYQLLEGADDFSDQVFTDEFSTEMKIGSSDENENYIDQLDKLLTQYQKAFKDLENLSPDQVLHEPFQQPTIFSE